MVTNTSASPVAPVTKGEVAVGEGVEVDVDALDPRLVGVAVSAARVSVGDGRDGEARGDELCVDCTTAMLTDSTSAPTTATIATKTIRNAMDRLSHQIPTR